MAKPVTVFRMCKTNEPRRRANASEALTRPNIRGSRMAKRDLAQEWLVANDPEKSEARKLRRAGRSRRKLQVGSFTKAHAAALKARSSEYVSVRARVPDPSGLHPLVIDGLVAVEVEERRIKSEVLVAGPTRSELIATALSRVIASDTDSCVFFPFNWAVILGRDSMPAYRAVAERFLPRSDYHTLVRHLCGNGHLGCCNPRHLRWGTDAENAQDRILHRAHPDRRPALSEEQFEEIGGDKRLPNVVAVECGIHSSLVEMIQAGVRWRPVARKEIHERVRKLLN